MRAAPLAAVLLLTTLAVASVPAEARPLPAECQVGFGYDACIVRGAACDAEARFYHHVPEQELLVDCAGGLSCGVEFDALVPTHHECDLPTGASDPYGCATTPHGARCTGDLVLCTTYSGAETNGLGHFGFDCGVASCDFVTYQGRIKSWTCS